ncbi:MAG TPA: NAD(P)-dependent oxidoreductase [Nocardioidaceae bacterium]
MRVLVTGAAGHIGSVLSDRLSARHQMRGLDLAAWHAPEDCGAAYPGEFVVGDCADPAVAAAAVDGMDAVVHLAGVASEAALPDILHGHVVGTAAILDAMVQHGVRRMVFASSNHAVGMTPRPDSGPIGVDTPARPDTFYGVGKVAGEALLSLYADRYGVSSVAMRIGSFRQRPDSSRHLSTWLSYDDCTAMVDAALTADFEGFRVVYGISANRDAWWDLGPGRALGFEPRDDAAIVAPELVTSRAPAIAITRVGGEFTTAEFDRRPFDVTAT